MGISLFTSVSAAVTILCILASLCPIKCDNSTSTVRPDPESRIIGGGNTTEGEFPHQVAIFTNRSICGGSILNEYYILTAGHCVVNVSQTGAMIVAGKHKLDFIDIIKNKAGGYNSAEIIMHSCYDRENIVIHDQNDIAIIKLAKPLPLNEQNIWPIQIDKHNLATDGIFTGAIGWGRTSAGGFVSEILKVVTLQAVTTACIQRFRASFSQTRIMTRLGKLICLIVFPFLRFGKKTLLNCKLQLCFVIHFAKSNELSYL